MKRKNKTADLILRYIRQELRFGQEKELNDWRSLSAENELFFQQQTSETHMRDRLRAHEESKKRIFAKIESRYPAKWIDGAPRRPALLVRMTRIAAIFIGAVIGVALLILSVGRYLDSRSSKSFGMINILGGQRVMLTDSYLGYLAGFRQFDVTRKKHNDLQFKIPNDFKDTKNRQDTLWTAPDWRFEMQLADGSGIWMNVSSTTSYPVNFSLSDSVSYYMKGEAYFRIPRSTNRHYEIKTDLLVIRANGAELNIRSGSEREDPGVLIISGTATVMPLTQSGDSARPVQLNPGQQARLVNSQIIVDEHPDIPAITDWKN